MELVRHGVEQKFRCRREVVVSAGAVGSPHLLMLSGISDRLHLEEVGVPGPRPVALPGDTVTRTPANPLLAFLVTPVSCVGRLGTGPLNAPRECR